MLKPILLNLQKKLKNLGAGELIINSIDLDGMMTGYDIELVKILLIVFLYQL